MPNIIINDEDLYCDAENILDEIGMDIQMAVNILLKRVVKERGISFLLKEAQTNMLTKPNVDIDDESEEGADIEMDIDKMTKSKAVSLFRKEGIIFNENINYSSKNRSVDKYWANPDFKVLEDDWFLILNDWRNNRLFLFKIPYRKLDASELICRNDKPYQIDIQIIYNDPCFTDARSKVCFDKFLIKTLDY